MSLRRWMLRYVLLFFTISFIPSLLMAQVQRMPKFQVFGGYSWLHPGGEIGGSELDDIDTGWGSQVTFNVNNWLGLTGDGGGHYPEHGGNIYTFTGGPQIHFHMKNFTPFLEGLFGAARFSPDVLPQETNFAVLAGGGLDLNLSRRVWIRFVQADYFHSSYSNSDMDGVRLQTGLILNFGLPKEEVVVPGARCALAPTMVDAGMPVELDVTTTGFSPKRKLSFSYSASGGKITGDGATASIETAGLAPGSYTAMATVTDDGKGKKQRQASCQASFTINAQHPPTLAVTANPTSVMPGESSKITATGNSPDNRPLTYECSATAGKLSGSGQQYTLQTASVAPGTIKVNCTVTDDRQLSATAGTSVTVRQPPPPAVKEVPPAPEPYQFGSIEFKHDARRPTRVDNEAKGELDRYADALAAAPSSRGVVVGHATNAEESGRGAKYAAQRAVNTKDYLVNERGIDPSRIETRAGSGNDKRVDLWIVPAGASFSQADTVQVDEKNIKAVPRSRGR